MNKKNNLCSFVIMSSKNKKSCSHVFMSKNKTIQ